MRQSNHLTNIYQNILCVTQLVGAPVCSIPGERAAERLRLVGAALQL